MDTSRPRRSFFLVLAALALVSMSPSSWLPHDPDERIRVLGKLIARRPADAWLWLRRGELYRQRGELRRALSDLDRAAKLGSEIAAVHFVRALTLLRARRSEDALAAVERFLRVEPGHGRALLLRARALTGLDRPKEAAAAYEAALRGLEPRRPQHYLERARAQAALGPSGVERALAGLEEGVRELGRIVSLTKLAEELAGNPQRPAAAVAAVTAVAQWRPATALPSPARAAPRPFPLAPAAHASTLTLVSKGAVWRYLDNGTDQGTAWRPRGFDDSGWASGPAELGYGDGDEKTVVSFGPNKNNKYITTYFRHSFQVIDTSVLKGARLRLLRDDGAVVYLNGTEVARSNMPNGAIGYRTRATSGIGGSAERIFHPISIDHQLLQKGANVVAVEIHQWSPTSSDISFDLELTGDDGRAGVVRGPYLQRGAPTSGVLRWRTDRKTKTVAWLGSAPDKLTVKFIDNTARTEHRAVLSGLTAGTTYFYAIGDGKGILAGADQGHRFITPPTFGTSQPTRVWAIGDSGTADARAAAVRDAYLNLAGTRHTDVWLMLGDNAYGSGTDDEYQAAVFDMYPSLLRRIFLWPTLGNHDAVSASSKTQSGVYYDIFSLPRNAEAGGLASGTEAYYSFDHGEVHFVCLDSHDSDRSKSGAMMTWLKADLAVTGARWVIAYWHHPPYTKGSHDSDNKFDSGGRLMDMREVALPILEAGGVDLVLSGHSHSYERSFLLDGHYGTSNTLTQGMMLDRGDGRASGDGAYAKRAPKLAPHQGAVYVVAGSSGRTGGGPLNHPAMFISLNELGSLVLDIDGDRLDAKFLEANGKVTDSFTLLKGVRRTLIRDEPRISISTGGAQNLFLDAGAGHAGKRYLLAGSFGTSPGFDLFGVHVPLNPDPWFDFSLGNANSTVFQNTSAVLDAAGKAKATVRLPRINNPSLVGIVLHHAYVVYGLSGFLMASNAVRLTLAR